MRSNHVTRTGILKMRAPDPQAQPGWEKERIRHDVVRPKPKTFEISFAQQWRDPLPFVSNTRGTAEEKEEEKLWEE